MAGRMSAKLSFLPAIEIPLVAMVLITLRVRTNLAMLRVPVDDGLSVRGLKQEVRPLG